ncbi:MAG: transposase [Phycisphaerae bacterium]|nr:transposase [Phycisphaerae bacterium]
MARVKHGQDDWLSYNITTCTLDGKFHLAAPREKECVIFALDYYRKKALYRLFGFVVMDNHIHFVIQPAPGILLGNIIRDLKRWTSHHNCSKPPGCPLWERRYDDNRITSTAELWSVLKYIHANPTRANIAARPEDYAWSSVHNYLDSPKAIIEIDADWWQY